MKIIIAGDLAPINHLEDEFKNKNSISLLGKELNEQWKSADFRIFNLETPLADNKNPIDKNGDNLIANSETINGIKSLEPSLILLANNHIMDQGYNGLVDTIKLMDNNDIPHIGAGNSIKTANETFIFEKNNYKVGVYNCAEHEFGIATEDLPGANPFDPLISLDDIQELSKECNFTIVIYHAGKEHYRYPSPNLQKICRRMIDKGADFVVTQHSHCIGSKEEYKGKTIVYGQGNFLFNYKELLDDPFWSNGMLIELELSPDNLTVSYIPYIATKTGVILANKNERDTILNDFYERSEKIKDREFIEKEYEKYAKKHLSHYLNAFSGWNIWLKRIDHHIFKGKLSKWYFNKKKLLAIKNIVKCEAHRELLLKGIENKIVK